MYKLFLCLRYLRRRRIAFFAVGAVCLCVAMVLIVVSVMGGFLQMVKDRSRGMLGDLIAENGYLQGFAFYEEFIDEIKNQDPQIRHLIAEATPVIITFGVLRFPRDQVTKAAQIVGIKREETYRVNDFKKGLFYEKYYPGTTTFAEQKEPLFGFGPDGGWVLPEELEAAWQRFRAAATLEELAQVPTDPDAPYKRPGYFQAIPPERVATDPGPAWLGGELPGIILGTDMVAERLDSGEYHRFYWRGEQVQLTMVPFTDIGTPTAGTGMDTKMFRYADDVRTGVYDIDSMSVYVDFDLLQRILLMDRQELVPDEEEAGKAAPRICPPRTTQVQIKLSPGADPKETRALVQKKWKAIAERHRNEVRAPELLNRVRVLTWEEKQARFIAAVEKEKYLVTVLFGVVSVVAVLLVGCIFYMIVQEKTRDIGIIKSVGATARGVAHIFLAYGAAVGVVGGVMGVILGSLFVHYINEVQALLARISGSLIIWDRSVYNFDRIPSDVKVLDAAVIYIVAIVASMAGALIAAFRAARVWPVEALRYE